MFLQLENELFTQFQLGKKMEYTSWAYFGVKAFDFTSGS